MKPPPREPAAGAGLILWITLALVAWGALLAAGAYFFGRTLPLAKAGLIFGCVAAFLGFWWIMLAARSRRLRQTPRGKP